MCTYTPFISQPIQRMIGEGKLYKNMISWFGVCRIRQILHNFEIIRIFTSLSKKGKTRRGATQKCYYMKMTCFWFSFFLGGGCLWVWYHLSCDMTKSKTMLLLHNIFQNAQRMRMMIVIVVIFIAVMIMLMIIVQVLPLRRF